MKNLYRLREMLLGELERYGQKDISSGMLSTVDTLAHAVKNLDKVIKCEEEGHYSKMSHDNDERMSYVRPDGSYRRENKNHTIVSELRMLWNDADDDTAKREIKRLIDRMEQM